MIRTAAARAVLFAMGAIACAACSPDASIRDGAESSMAPVIPAPLDVKPGAGAFKLSEVTAVHVSPEAEQVARYFVDLMRRTRGVDMDVVPHASSAAESEGIHFELAVRERAIGEEAYSLVVDPQRIVVSAGDARGLFYGAVTLWQLMTADSSPEIRIPAMAIDDAPRFRWRGLMLDSARHYQSTAFVKKFIDAMALHKLNVLHWHLVDDQGWRIEIKKYPQLTARGAWRVPAGAGAQQDVDPSTGKPRLYGGYYTQDEIRGIVAHARSRHITIVPEIEMPGHATAAIVAYPHLASTRTSPKEMPADWGIYPNLFNVEEATFAFLEDVLREVIDLFPSPYIHVGGDEAVKDQWRESPQVQARMRELGIADEHALQSYFIQRMERFLNAQGRRLIGWDEILEGGLAPNATVMSWRGIDGAVAAAAAGHDAVLSPWPTLYLDNRQSAFDTQPGRGAIIGLEEVYGFDPLPAQILPEQRKHVLGLQANLWTEHMRTEERVEHMAFPRAAALAEVAWSPAERLSWSDFEQRLETHFDRYASLGIRYARPAAPVEPASSSRTSHALKLCSDKLVLSLEDDAPVRGARETFLVDVMQPCWIFPAVDLTQFTAVEADVGQVPFNFQIGRDREAIRVRTPRTPSGELEVRAGCEGPVLAALSLAPALDNPVVTSLRPATLSGSGIQDLCFTFTQASLDPLWVLHRIRLIPSSPSGT